MASIVPLVAAREQQAVLGCAGHLVVGSAPAGAEGFLGWRLIDVRLKVAGTYRCVVSLAGAKAQVNAVLKATLTSGTATAKVLVVYLPSDVSNVTTWEDRLTGNTAASLSSGTVLEISKAGLTGDAWAVVEVVVSGATPDVAFAIAQYRGA